MHQVDDIPAETFFRSAKDEHEHATRGAVVIDEDGETEPSLWKRSGNINLSVQKANKDFRKYFFSNRVVTPWNNLPNSVKFADSVNQFKNLYDDHVK